MRNVSDQQRHAGFSLIELLLVVFVIVMLTTMVSLNVGSGGEQIKLQSTVSSLVDNASFALDEAQFSGRDFGLLLEQGFDSSGVRYTWHWQERFIEGWDKPASGNDVFKPLPMPEGIDVVLEIENSPFSEVDIDEAEEDEDATNPQIVFYASGETTIGAIDIRQRDSGELLWRIEWDLLGRFEVLPGGIRDDDDE